MMALGAHAGKKRPLIDMTEKTAPQSFKKACGLHSELAAPVSERVPGDIEEPGGLGFVPVHQA